MQPPKKRISLKSDFEDYYDSIFSYERRRSWERWEFRRYQNILDKVCQLRYLADKHGFILPPILKSSAINPGSFSHGEETKVVVYDKNRQMIMSVRRARKEFPDNLIRPLVYTANAPSTYKVYRIGSTCLTVLETSNHLWRSDRGDIHQKLVDNTIIDEPNTQHPISCTMFTVAGDGVLFLTEYSEAPKLENTPVHEHMTPENILCELLTWHEEGYEK